MKRQDARLLAPDTQLECDLCIVGAGPAGLSIAAEMIGRGHDVILLDAGGPKQEKSSQAFYEGETDSAAHPPPHMYRQRRLGGSATIWGGRCVPFDRIDFERRDHVPLSGWPIDRATLDPFYARAQDVLDAGAFDYSARTSYSGGALIAGFDDPAISTDSIERFSLPTNPWKKFGAALTAARDIRIVSHAACQGFRTAAGSGRVDHALFATAPGRTLRVRARTFVSAVGGIETVRLLAGSGPAGSSHGLGNHADWLGRTYMCHVEVAIGALRLEPASRAVSHGFERTRDGIYSRRRFTMPEERQRALGVMNWMARLHHANIVNPAHGDGILSTMFLAKRFVIPEFRRKLAMVEHAAIGELRQDTAFWAAHIRNMALGAPRLAGFLAGWVAHRHLQRRIIPYVALHNAAGRYALDFNSEQAPNRDSRVTLAEQSDAFGARRVRVDWRMSELDVRTISIGLRELRDAIARSGVGRIDFDDARLEEQARTAVPVGGHHIGTARMSADPGLGVVDGDARVHHVDNLHVAGAAVFPTSSHANPTLTIVALALRLAARIDADLKRPARA